MQINKSDMQIAGVFIGTIMGAGFASGQELMQFFVNFGYKGIWGVIISGVFFALLGGITILVTKHYNFKTYKDLIDSVLGRNLANLLDWLIISFLFLGFSVMLSGSGALFREHLGLESWMGIVMTEILVLMALLARDEGVMWFNSLLVPMLILVTVGIALASFNTTTVLTSQKSAEISNMLISNNWLWATVLYVSYNMLSGVVVLVSLSSEEKKCTPTAGIVGGIILLILALCVVVALMIKREELTVYQIPMLFLAFRVNSFMFYIYGAVLWAAMLTTAVADAYGLCKRLQIAWNRPYFFVLSLILICAIPFSLCDFSVLVARIYPLFGYIGFFVIICLLVQSMKIIIKYL